MKIMTKIKVIASSLIVIVHIILINMYYTIRSSINGIATTWQLEDSITGKLLFEYVVNKNVIPFSIVFIFITLMLLVWGKDIYKQFKNKEE